MTYVVRRLLLIIPVAFFVFTLVFSLIRLVPGDAVDALLIEASSSGDPEVEARLRSDLGIDEPFVKQYFVTLGRFARGDLGDSFLDGQPVIDEVLRRAPITLEVAGLAMLIALLISVPAGVVSALRQDTIVDYIARVSAVTALAVPGFWIATLVIVFPAKWWGYSAPIPYQDFLDNPLSNLEQVLPAAAVSGAIVAGILARFIRSSLLEVLRQDYVRTARAKGLKERRVIFIHAMKNAMGPSVTVGGLIFANLMASAIIIETIFSIPGLGMHTVNSIAQRDYPALQAITIFFAMMVVFVNLSVDLIVAWLDPRIRYA